LQRLADDHKAPALVLVTHHVEEIPPGFTHALVIAAGRIVASGPIGDVISGPILTAAFALPIDVTVDSGRFSARRSSR
jgi:iron complex transport system ATP-binding protein